MNDLFTLNDITQEDVDQAKAILLNLIKSDPQYINLDLNPGTALYDLLLRPAAELRALEYKKYTYLRTNSSLKTISEAGETADSDAVNAILANFNMEMITGSKATGSVLVKVSKDREYTVPANTVFTDSSSNNFNMQAEVSASMNPSSGQIQLYQASDDTYYFLVPVIAEDYGTKYLLSQGTRLNMSFNIFDFVSAEAYADFEGATPAETVDDLITRIPSAISNRGLESRVSIESVLTSPDHGNFESIRAISIVGAGDSGQLRDKHNVLGGSMFGRVDIYPRTFFAPPTVALLKTGTRIAPATYSINIASDEAPGFYAIKSITDAESVVAPIFDFDSLMAIGSYPYIETRGATGITDTIHDISLSNQVIESAYTKYQTSTIIVSNVTTAADETHEFKVELYVAPDIGDIQDYVDRSDIRNIKADYLVRSPLICTVALRALIEIDANADVDADDIKTSLMEHINNKSFVSKLTQTEIIGVISDFDIKDINLSNDITYGFKMEGRVRDAAGTIHTLYGPNLNIYDIEDADTLVLPNTCVFGCNAYNISIQLRKV